MRAHLYAYLPLPEIHLPPPEINHFTHLTSPYSSLMHLNPPYSPLAPPLLPPCPPPTKGGQTPPSILLSFTHFKDCHVIFALCYTVYSKDFLFNTLKIAVIKHKVVLKGNYMRLQFVRLQNFL